MAGPKVSFIRRFHCSTTSLFRTQYARWKMCLEREIVFNLAKLFSSIFYSFYSDYASYNRGTATETRMKDDDEAAGVTNKRTEEFTLKEHPQEDQHN